MLRRRSLFSLVPVLLAIAVLLALLFVPGARADINVAGSTGATSYLLGETIVFNASVELTTGETAGITAVELLIEQTDTEGDQPVTFESFTVDLPLEAGLYDPSDFPDVPGDMTVVVATENIVPGGYVYAYFYAGEGAPGRFQYTIFWDPPIFLDPGPVFTLIPETVDLFAIPDPPAPEDPPADAPVDLPDATIQFAIPEAPVTGLPADPPDPLPATEVAFPVPFLATEDPSASPLPGTDLAFVIPLGEDGGGDGPDELPTVTKLFDIPFVGEEVTGRQLPSTDLVYSVPEAPMAEAIAGVEILPETEFLFDIVDGGGRSRTPRGIAVEPNSDIYLLVDGLDDDPDQIMKFDEAGNLITSFGTGGVAFVVGDVQETLRDAEGIAFLNDGTTDVVWVAENTFSFDDWEGNRVLKFDATTGAFLGTAFYPGFPVCGMHGDSTSDPVSLWLFDCNDYPVISQRTLGGTTLSDTSLNLTASPGGLAVSETDLFTGQSTYIQRREKTNPSNTIGSAVNPDTVVVVAGMALDAAGRMFLADPDAEAVYLTQFFQAETVTTNPLGMAYDSVADELYILEEASPKYKIVVVDPADASDPPTPIRSFNAPDDTGVGITFLDASPGFLYYAHNPGSFDRRVKKLDPSDGSVVDDLELFDIYNDLRAISNDGADLLVTTQFDNRIFVIDPGTGNWGSTIEPPGGVGIDAADGLAFNGGRFYQGKSTEVVELAENGDELRSFNVSGFDVEALTFVGGVLYIGNDSDDTIRKGAIPPGETTEPIDIAYSAGSDVVWVLVEAIPNDIIIKMEDVDGATDSDGDGTPWDLVDTFDAPNANAQGITHLNGFLYVAHRDPGLPAQVSEINPATGAVLDTFDAAERWSNQLWSDITTLADDGTDLVYVRQGDSFLTKIRRTNGSFEEELSPPGGSSAIPGSPALAFKDDGQIFEAEGEEVFQFTPDLGDVASFPTTLTDIRGLALSDGTIYLANSGSDAIWAAGAPTGLTTDPLDLAIDTANSFLFVLVDGAVKDRVLKLDLRQAFLGTLLDQFDAPDNKGGGITLLDGSLYYASRQESEPAKISELDPSNGSVLSGPFDVSDGCCTIFSDVTAMDNDGVALILAIQGWDRLILVDPADGDFEGEIYPSGGLALAGPRGLARDSTGGFFEAKNRKIVQLTSGLDDVASFTTSLDDITGLVIGADDVLFIADDTADADDKIYKATAPTDITTNPIDLAYSTSSDVVWVLIEAAPVPKIAKMVDDGTDTDGDGDGTPWDLETFFDAPVADGAGLTFLGTSLYYAANPTSSGPMIYELDPTNGTELNQFAPDDPWGYPLPNNITAMDNDGTNLALGIQGNDRLFLNDPANGSTEGELPDYCCPPSGPIFGPDALAIELDGAIVAVHEAEDEEIIQLDESFFVTDTFTTDREEITGMVFGGKLLYVADDADDTVYVTRPPNPISTDPLGLTFGNPLYALVEGTPEDHILVIDRDTGDLLDDFSAGTADGAGITFLDGSLWVVAERVNDPCCEDARVIQIDPDTGDELGDFGVIPNYLEPGGISNDGEFLYIISRGVNDISVMNTGGGDEQQMYAGGNGGRGLAFSADEGAFFKGKNDDIQRFSSDLYSITETFGNTVVGDIQGMTFVQDATFGEVLYLANGDDDSIYAAFLPQPDVFLSTEPKAMSEGSDLWLVVETEPRDRIMQLNAETGAIIDHFDAPRGDVSAITIFDHDGDSTESIFVGVTRDREGGGPPNLPLIFELDLDGNEIQRFELRAPDGSELGLGIGGMDDNGAELIVGFRHEDGAPSGAKLMVVDLGLVADQEYVSAYDDFLIIPGVRTGDDVESVLVALGNAYLANGTSLVQLDLTDETVEAEYDLEGSDLDVKGMAYIDTTAFLADDVTDSVRNTVFPENTPENTIVGTYTPTFSATADSDTVEQVGSPFVIVRNPDPIIQIDEPLPGFAASEEIITIRGRSNDPSLETVTVGVDLPFTTLFEDVVTVNPSTDLWDVTGLWHIVTKPNPDVDFPKAQSEPSSWYYGIDAQQNFDTGAANSGALTMTNKVTVGEGARFVSHHWYETDPDPERDKKLIQKAEVTTDSEDNDVVGDFQTIAQIVDFVPADDDAAAAAAFTAADDADIAAANLQDAIDAGAPVDDIIALAFSVADAAEEAALAAQDAADATGGAAQDAADNVADAANVVAAAAAAAATAFGDGDDAGAVAAAQDAADSTVDTADAARDAAYVADVFEWVTVTPAAFTFEAGPGGPVAVPFFQRVELDLTPFIDEDIVVRFLFDSIDAGINNGEGWNIDDIIIAGAGFSGLTVDLTPIPGGPIDGFFSEFETTFSLTEGPNTAIARAKLIYPPFLTAEDSVTGVLDLTPPFVEFDPQPATTNVATQTLTGFIVEDNFALAEMTQENAFGIKTVLALDSLPADGRFSKIVSLAEGLNIFEMIVIDAADLDGNDILEMTLDVEGPDVEELPTTYPDTLVSARPGDLLVLQVDAEDEIGVDRVFVSISGEEFDFIPSSEIPEAFLALFRTEGTHILPFIVPLGTPSGDLFFSGEALDGADNPTPFTLQASIVSAVEASVIDWLPGPNNWSLPIIPERNAEEPLGMDVRDFVSNLRQLTETNPSKDYNSSISNSSTLSFISDRDSPDVFDIFLMNADGTEQTNLTNSPTVDERWPVLTQDDTIIAFMSDEEAAAGEFDLWLMSVADPSVKTMVAITDMLGLTLGADSAPAPSPDGSQIAMTASGDGNGGIVRMVVMDDVPTLNAAGDDFEGGPATLTDLGLGANPVFSPDGSTIAFDLNGDIWTMPADGADTETDGTNLTAGLSSSGFLFDPTWNEDGTRLAFLRVVATEIVDEEEVVTATQILAMNADGSQVLTLTRNDSMFVDLSNHPAGYGPLLFSSDRDTGDFEIYAIEPPNLAGTEAVWWYNALELVDENGDPIPKEERWHVFTPGEAPDDVDIVATGRAYWSIMKEIDATLADDGFEWDLSEPLAEGLSSTPAALNASYFGTFLIPGKSVPPAYLLTAGADGLGAFNQVGYHGSSPLQLDVWMPFFGVKVEAMFEFLNLIDFELGSEGEDPEFTIIQGAFNRMFPNDDATPTRGFWGFVTEDVFVVPGAGGAQ